jgi:hypothetical protein
MDRKVKNSKKFFCQISISIALKLVNYFTKVKIKTKSIFFYFRSIPTSNGIS